MQLQTAVKLLSHFFYVPKHIQENRGLASQPKSAKRQPKHKRTYLTKSRCLEQRFSKTNFSRIRVPNKPIQRLKILNSFLINFLWICFHGQFINH